MARSYQAVVIGGGPGGYVAAIRLAQLGLKTAVIEKEKMGGVCLNWGCVPSKALIHVAHTVSHLAEAKKFGVSAEGVSVDVDETRAWKDKIVAKLTGGVAQLVKGNGGEIIEGEARFAGPGRLLVNDEEIHFEHCIIATGARPIAIPGFEVDGELIWGSRTATDLPRIPRHLVVIGGGVIGLELGTVYAKLGAKVTIVEMLDGLLPGIDPELTRVVERKLKKMKIDVKLETKASGLVRRDDGSAELTLAGPKGEEKLEADAILMAVGFRPNTEALELDKVGVQVDEKGAIVVDERLATTAAGIHAIGDVTGAPFLAHRAFKQGEVAAEAIAGHPEVWDVKALPAVVFTDPEIASTGLSEDAAKAAGHEVKTGKFHFLANGRALGSAETDGFVKVVVDAASEAVLGVQIVGAGASDLIAEGTLAVEMGAVADDVGLTVHAHPTLAEAVQEATMAAVGRAVHAINK
ncbi:MAG: dihydrolipoyl dehydrogenase [Deltaproteobacteria bacterium]|nr:dihydrolipoyl dehydrogenase [Deltaproteobacteria bacterium]